jgi:Xaa-Pro aminopeptidase
MSLKGPFQPPLLSQRRERLRALFAKSKVDAALITHPVHILYFAGFESSNAQILVTRRHGDYLLTDFRYIEAAKKTAHGMTVVEIRQFRDQSLSGLLADCRIRRLGAEEASQTHGAWLALAETLEKIELQPMSEAILGLRQIKDAEEIQAITRAQKLNEQLQRYAVDLVKTRPMTEAQLRREIRNFLMDHQAEEAFDTIVASGANSSLPHAKSGSRALSKGGFLTLDSGARLAFYHSDMTRTYQLSPISPKLREIYEVVLEAQLAGLAEVRPGTPCAKVDQAARSIIQKAGYGDFFGHGTGHGVGLQIHEGPRLNQTSKETLRPGMVVTVEPGIYLPGLGGVRIEDLLVVTEDGATNINKLSKKLSPPLLPESNSGRVR